MRIPQIQIKQTPATLGMDTVAGTLEIRQPKAQYEMKTIHQKQYIQSPHGELEIDQSQAWDALGIGSVRESMQRIYTDSKQIAIQGVARRVQEGNRMADSCRTGENVIAALAHESTAENSNGLVYHGEASFLNVHEHYTAHMPEITTTPGRIEVHSQAPPPIIKYNRGKLNIYMISLPSIEFIPPQMDLKL
jgi:hypothetical protein